ncbi:DUF6236 family protein, partial [Streptomyces sp. NPDC051917]|uniref:DUF6236 family protein n=1 Tax=Streptomyces sp. NPDC051917 TaxID=3154754 RepID=UPI00345418BF
MDELAEELATVTVQEARELQVAARVEKRFAQPLRELRRAMNALRIDTAFSAADLKFSLPSVIGAGALGTIENQPVLGATVGAAFGLVSRSGDPVAVAADTVDDLVRGFGPSEGPGL